MDGARDELLARAALPRDEHRGLGVRHALDDVEDLSEQGALPDDVVEPAALDRVAAKAPDLFLERRVPEDTLDREHQLLGVERLDEEIGGARAKRLDGRLER